MDIYFEPEYGKLNEQIEGGVAETFRFACEYGTVQSVFIKREVPYLIDGVQYYDAITPYGYGGPVVIECVDREKLVEAYGKAYRRYCVEQKIVDEFVRFHPLAGNDLDFGEAYDTTYNRHTIAVDLTDDNYSAVQFTPDCRNMIRKAEKKGVRLEIDTECRCMDDFIRMYYATMDKNNASKYYYFSREYFDGLKSIDCHKLILINGFVEDKIISSAMFMCSDEYMHYHLAATEPEYYAYSANNIILAKAIEYGREMGLKWLHLGGGLSSDEKDRLFKFKRNFGRTENNLKDFYIGKAVFMPEVYEKLCKIAKENGIKNDGFFPAYRKAH